MHSTNYARFRISNTPNYGQIIINLLLKYLALFARLGAILSDGLISSVTTAIFKIFTIIPLIYAGFTCKKS